MEQNFRRWNSVNSVNTPFASYGKCICMPDSRFSKIGRKNVIVALFNNIKHTAGLCLDIGDGTSSKILKCCYIDGEYKPTFNQLATIIEISIMSAQFSSEVFSNNNCCFFMSMCKKCFTICKSMRKWIEFRMSCKNKKIENSNK